MALIGLTGGIGSGKSTVARMLSDRGALVIDADAIAREVVEPGSPGLSQIVETFGVGTLAAGGQLDRAALAAVVFADQAALAQLNAITHPLIAARTAQLMAAAEPGQPVVHDVPLLVENDLAGAYDLVVVVLADLDARVRRLEQRGMSRPEIEQRLAAQADDAARRDVADVVIDNSGSLEQLCAQVDSLWETMKGMR